jgi:hypothetical protein
MRYLFQDWVGYEVPTCFSLAQHYGGQSSIGNAANLNRGLCLVDSPGLNESVIISHLRGQTRVFIGGSDCATRQERQMS